MHTIKTSIQSILRQALNPARAPHSQRQNPETLGGLGDWILRDLGMRRSEHDKASAQVVMRAYYGL
jgi:hypothetical protein